MSFQSPDPSRGMIENVFKGQFMSEKLVQLRYEKRAKHIIGYGTVSLELSPDMQELRGHNSGLSSHTGKLFVSNVFLKKDDGSKATSCFEAEYLRSLSLSPRVFIGHGKDRQWRELENHLREKQGFTVVGYELGVRAGCTVVEVLSEMLEKSSIAFLVMTAEDKMDSGEMRARQNVVHEIGLFQGRLGFKRAIVLVEDGVEEFRNITGLNPIPFAAGRIQEIFGDVVAIIRREFPAQVPAR
jgi:hypothetical protein